MARMGAYVAEGSPDASNTPAAETAGSGAFVSASSSSAYDISLSVVEQAAAEVEMADNAIKDYEAQITQVYLSTEFTGKSKEMRAVQGLSMSGS